MKSVDGARLAGVLAAVCLVGALYSCAQTRSVRTGIFEDRRTSVVLRGWVDRDSGQAQPMGFAHPAPLAADELKFLLASIYYEEKGLFGWSEARRVFSADELYRIGPHLSSAFEQADAGKEILFRLNSAKAGAVFSTDRLTDGTMFIKDGKLNCVFKNANSRTDSESDAYDGNPRRYYAGALWRLAPKEGQILLEDEGGLHYNWITLDIKEGLAQKQRMDKLLIERVRARKRPPVKQQPEVKEPGHWEDWVEGAPVQEQPRPDVYFPDEWPGEKQEE